MRLAFALVSYVWKGLHIFAVHGFWNLPYQQQDLKKDVETLKNPNIWRTRRQASTRVHDTMTQDAGDRGYSLIG